MHAFGKNTLHRAVSLRQNGSYLVFVYFSFIYRPYVDDNMTQQLNYKPLDSVKQRLCFCAHEAKLNANTYSVSQKNPPCGFLKFFPKWLGIFNQFFTQLLCDHFYTREQIFIQISPTLTKLCHTKRHHLAKFYVSL